MDLGPDQLLKPVARVFELEDTVDKLLVVFEEDDDSSVAKCCGMVKIGLVVVVVVVVYHVLLWYSCGFPCYPG